MQLEVTASWFYECGAAQPLLYQSDGFSSSSLCMCPIMLVSVLQEGIQVLNTSG